MLNLDRESKIRKVYLGLLLFSLLVAMFVIGASLLSGDSAKLIVSDGSGYYAWIRSLFIDGDFNFANDFPELYYPTAPPFATDRLTPNGLVPNKYPIGLAIVEVPGFLTAHLIAKVTPFAVDGQSLPYQLAICGSIIALIIFSFYLLYLALINYQFNPLNACIFSAMALFATNLIHYFAKEPAMAHGSDVALFNVIIFMSSLQYRPDKKTGWFNIFCGLLIGLTLIIRNTNIVFIPCFIWLFSNRINFAKIRQIGVGIALMLLVHLASLFLLWGKFTLHSYQGEGFDGGWLGLWSSLFGQGNGLFLYHPWYLVLVLLNILGLWMSSKNRWGNLAILVSFSGLWIINGFWGFAGDSFGHRAFIESIPFLTFGAVCTAERKLSLSFSNIYYVMPLLVLLISCNFYLWGGYLLQKYPHHPERTLIQAYSWLINY